MSWRREAVRSTRFKVCRKSHRYLFPRTRSDRRWGSVSNFEQGREEFDSNRTNQSFPSFRVVFVTATSFKRICGWLAWVNTLGNVQDLTSLGQAKRTVQKLSPDSPAHEYKRTVRELGPASNTVLYNQNTDSGTVAAFWNCSTSMRSLPERAV